MLHTKAQIQLTIYLLEPPYSCVAGPIHVHRPAWRLPWKTKASTSEVYKMEFNLSFSECIVWSTTKCAIVDRDWLQTTIEAHPAY